MSDTSYDNEVKEGFTRLQKKVFDAKRMMASDAELKEMKEKLMTAAKFVKSVIGDHPTDHKMYYRIGNAYILSEKDTEQLRMQKVVEEIQQDVKAIDERKESILRSVNEAQNEMRELVASRKAS